ncbi:MAG: inorganic phosphate transporter [Moraxellaceae bacterium]|nr:MAG: inorganic phosphate transporter [Moraxellaceae bacterium]
MSPKISDTNALGLLIRLAIVALFGIGIIAYTTNAFASVPHSSLLIIAAVIGGYMALNIGANDVANNVGPAVGSLALSMGAAIVIAAIFEAGGAIIAGGDVVSTIKKGIIDPSNLSDPMTFIWVMMAALLAGAIWLNLATAVGAPVSTTHSIVGGVLGAGIAAGGMEIANWNKMGAIAASWVISPVLGGLIAAGFLFIIKRLIIHQDDMITAAKRILPFLLAIMSWAFITYLCLKGVKKIWAIDFQTAMLLGFFGAIATVFLSRQLIAKAAEKLNNDRHDVSNLFTLPLIFSAALLSFAHGANDVANAIGPLAAINDAIINVGISEKAAIPLWVMLIGAIGIAIGLALFGPKLIRTVGTEITDLDKPRAFCIALAAAITVIIASQLGLPVSSTHIAVGGIFGVGFLREYLKRTYLAEMHAVSSQLTGKDKIRVEHILNNHTKVTVEEINKVFRRLKQGRKQLDMNKKEIKRLKKGYKEELVKRSALYKIVAAWIITVPASAALAALLFFTLRGMLGS